MCNISGDEKLELIEQDNFAKAVINSKKDSDLHKKMVYYKNYDDFLTIIKFFSAVYTLE